MLPAGIHWIDFPLVYLVASLFLVFVLVSHQSNRSNVERHEGGTLFLVKEERLRVAQQWKEDGTSNRESLGIAPYLEKKNLKMLLRNTEPKTGTTALEWTIMALFREACAEFRRIQGGSEDDCIDSEDKENREYALQLSGRSVTFNSLGKHQLDFEGYLLDRKGVNLKAESCMHANISGWSESCSEFASLEIPDYVGKENEDVLYVNIYRDPIATSLSWVNFVAKERLSEEELNRQVKDICPHVAARIGLRARIAWKILPSKGYPVYSYGYETMMDRQDIWVGHLLKAMGLHMSSESVRAALDSVSPSAMKDLLEQAKEGLVKELPAGLDLKGAKSRKVGNATSKGYVESLYPESIQTCREVALKHLPPEMIGRYFGGVAN